MEKLWFVFIAFAGAALLGVIVLWSREVFSWWRWRMREYDWWGRKKKT